MSKLALLGGDPEVRGPLPPYPSMGQTEMEAVLDVVRSGCLSGFYGDASPEFLGGSQVRAFEESWGARYDVPHVVSMNSATSGLFAAMGAIGVGPGDEVIVPCTTMSATAMAPLVYGAIPVFVDIEDETFCLDLECVRAAITPRTRAILAVNLFGHPARLADLRALADAKGLFLVEDNAQAPLGREHGLACGTIGHIGVFSLNFHKHIHTGEGGMCVTADARLAERLQLIRNHGENLVEPRKIEDAANIIGFNYRMTELSAAVGLAQLAGIDDHVEIRERLAQRLSNGTRDLPGWKVPAVREQCRHNYYCWTPCFDENVVGIDRDTFSRALIAEGFPHAQAYVKPLYMLPVFQRRIGFGRDGFPFNQTEQRYEKGMCPVAERLHEREILFFEPCAYLVDDNLADQLVEAVRKVHTQAGELVGMRDAKVSP